MVKMQQSNFCCSGLWWFEVMLRTCSDHFTSTRSKAEWNVFFWTRKPLTDGPQYSFLWKKKQMSTIALKDNDHHLATEIFVHMTSPHPHCPFDILSAISSHYYSFPFLPSPLFTSIPLPSLLPLYPGGRDQQHGVRLPSIYSFRLSMLCIHNLAEASHHTHHASNVAS